MDRSACYHHITHRSLISGPSLLNMMLQVHLKHHFGETCKVYKSISSEKRSGGSWMGQTQDFAAGDQVLVQMVVCFVRFHT